MNTGKLHLAVMLAGATFYLLLSWNSFAQFSSEQVEKVVNDSRLAIAKIRVTGTRPGGQHVDEEGTGFFVGSDEKRTFIVTALHIIGSISTEQAKNPDWKVENGRIERKIEISSLDSNNTLIRRTGTVHALSTGFEGADFTVLMIEQGPFPTLALGDPLNEKKSIHNVILLGFGAGSPELTKPYQIATGQTSGISYVTSLPSRPGESGGPWIDIASGKVLGVASGIQSATTGAKNESTVATIVIPALAIYFRGAANAMPVPLEAIEPPTPEIGKPTSTPSQQSAPPEFAGLDVIYFERSTDNGEVQKALDDAGLVWRRLTGDARYASNVVTCGSDQGLAAAKKLAMMLLDKGVQIKGIAPQRRPISNKVTVEYYADYRRQPTLTGSLVANISACPTWSERLSPIIKVQNACYYGRLDIYLRYFHTAENRWITTARFGLRPQEDWVLTDATGPVGSGRPYILIAAVASTDYEDADLGDPQGTASDASHTLESIPDQYFHKARPVVRYGCPR